MRGLVGALVLLAASCGDNKKPAVPDDAPRPDAPTNCGVRGTHIGLRQIAWGCMVKGAPLPPNCTGDIVSLVTSPPNDPRVFALELNGVIRILENDRLRPNPFLDISEDSGGPVIGIGVTELGLLGLAFDPNYATNHQFYVFYTTYNSDTTDTLHPYLDVLARYTTSATDPNRADPDSGVIVLAIPDPFANHNGGMIEFGNDGFLYISTGDGGGDGIVAPDAYNNGQNLFALLGKILRIDVDHKDFGKEYAIPVDNPYASGADGAPEVWLRGLRNPWRWSFDRANGDMWIGDVGQALYEELDYLPAGEQAGKNLGWSTWEGNSCFKQPCDDTGITFPVNVHAHSEGWWAIIGGQVYRGSCFPDLVGTYVFADCGANQVFTGRWNGGQLEVSGEPDAITLYPASLHADSRGELYLTTVPGNIYQIVVEP